MRISIVQKLDTLIEGLKRQVNLLVGSLSEV